MEFPRVHQTPGMQAGYSGVNQIVCPVPNANPRPADFFGRGGGMEAASHGLMACNAIDLGGGGDGKRGFRPTSVGPAAVSSGMNFRQGNSVGVSSGMNFGQGNSAGVSTGMNFGQGNSAGVSSGMNFGQGNSAHRVDPEIMLSLDDILDDLHKKVVSGDANAFEVRGGSVKTHGFGSGNPKAQENVYEGAVANLQRKNKQNKGNFAGSLQMERNKQSEAGVVCLSEGNEQQKSESVSLPNQQECEVAGSQGKVEHPQKDGFANLQEANEATGQLSTSDKGDASGLLQTNAQDKGAGSLEINQEGGAEGVQEAENSLQPESEKALELVGGGELQPVLSTPRKGKQISRRPTEIIESPDWLPPGWRTELKTREAGSSAGLKDKYYYDPVSQRRFRSKVEVLTYLETGKVGRHRPKTEREVGRKRKSGLFYNAAALDPNIKLTKVRWVLDDSDGSWIPFVNEEELNGYNKKEGERCFDLNHNSADASDRVQGQANVLKDANPLTSMKNSIMRVGVGPGSSKTRKVPNGVLSTWSSEPCLKFSVKALGVIPDLDENLALTQGLEYYLGEPTTIIGSYALSNISSCSPCNEQRLLSAEGQLPLTKNSHESSTYQTILSASDSLSKQEWNSCTYDCREKQLVRKRDKELLEPLGRKLCIHALNILKGHKLSSLYVEKRSTNNSIPFEKRTILTSSFAL